MLGFVGGGFLQRGLFALSLLWESPLCDDQVAGYLQGQLALQRLREVSPPPTLVAGIEALCRRIELRERTQMKAQLEAEERIKRMGRPQA